MARLSRHAASLACLVALASAAPAKPLKSRYTTLETAACSAVPGQPAGRRAFTCRGLPGFPIHYAEAGQRPYLSLGPRPEQRTAASQTLEPPSSIFKGVNTRATIEWRFNRRDGRDVPYAAIVRYFTRAAEGAAGAKGGEVLVVTRIGPTDSCHIAHIDALANPEAIALARSVADEAAGSPDCKSPPRVIGATGKSPM